VDELPPGDLPLQQRRPGSFRVGKVPAIRPVSYGQNDGLQSAECCTGVESGLLRILPGHPGVLKDRGGRLWFATGKGVAVVDPGRLRTNPVSPPVLIEEVLLDGKPFDPESGILVPPDTKQLQIRYTALSLGAPEELLFRTAWRVTTAVLSMPGPAGSLLFKPVAGTL